MSIGAGFVSEHLPYQNITERVTGVESVDKILDRHQPDVLVNCIGKTGRPNVDWCEANKEETAYANVAVPIMLAEGCKKRGIHMIQIGSGCIFFGKSPYKGERYDSPDPGWKEDDIANPKSFYSKTKYSCDLTVGAMDNVATLRIRMPVTSRNVPRNLINKLRGYSQVIDIPNSMTFMEDLTRCISWVAANGHSGIWHVTNPEPITAAQIMTEYQKYVPDHKFEIINEAQLDSLTVAKRSNCIINSGKLKAAGFVMTPSEIALKRLMADYVKNL